MLGDSLTSLGEWSRLLPGADIGNRGVGGETSAGLRARIEGGEPVGRTAFVLIGINDEAEEISEAETFGNLAAIVRALKGRRIFLQSTLPRTTSGDTDRVNRLAAFERRLCGDGRCSFVDLRPALAPTGVLSARYSTDGTHLSWPAYQVWGAIVRRSLSAASPPPVASDRPAAVPPHG
jgi:lysophospholipase L1-like esterase